jgi:photosystem II stability/assembly factor-like uncharacterized protein
MPVFCLANEWAFQNPQPDGNFVEDIHYFNDSHAIAVGNCGRIWIFNNSQWKTENTQIQADLEAIWADDANNIFVAGKNGVIFRYDGSKWEQLDLGAIINLKNIHFSDIWVSNNSIHAVGDGIVDFEIDQTDNSIHFFNHNIPDMDFNAILGHSENEIFAVGEDGIIFYYNGNKWIQQNSPTEKDLESLWKSSSNDYYAVGEDGIFLAYRGALWTEIETNLTYHFFDINGSDDNNIWIAGGIWQQSGILIHFNGEQFSTPYMLTKIPFSAIDITDHTIYAAGAEMYAYTQNQWTKDESFRKGFSSSIRGIWGNSTDNIYAVGENASLFHFNGNTWKKETVIESSNHLNAIWGLDSDCILTVGDNGTMIYYNGISWSRIPEQTQNDLLGVWGKDNQFFVVGQNGTLYHFQDYALTVVETKTETRLNAIWGTDVNYYYAAGNNGLILRFNEFGCSEMNTPTQEHLFDIWGHQRSNIYAVGKNGCILHYNGSTWQQTLQSITSGQLNTVWGTSRDTYVAGEYGQVLSLSNGNWLEVLSGTTNWLADGFSINEYDMLIAGFGGTVLQYTGQRILIDVPAYILNTAETFSVTTTVYPVSAQTINLSILPEVTVTTPSPIDQNQQIKVTELQLKDDIKGDQRITITAQIDNGIVSASTDTWLIDSQSFQEVITNCNLKTMSGWDKETIYAMGINGDIRVHNNDTFSLYPFVINTTIEDIWYASKNTAYAVGHNGIILSYHDSEWIVLPSNTQNENLNGIWGVHKDNVFAVGDNGTIIHYDGEQWVTMESGTNKKLYAIWGTSINNIYAVGESSTILQYNGKTWNNYMGNADFDLFDIWGVDSNTIFVSGSNGIVMFFDGINWVKQNTGMSANLYGIWGTCDDEIFVVGDKSTIGYYDGKEWLQLFDPLIDEKTITFWDVWGTNGKNVYFTGNAIYTYQPSGLQLSPIHSQIVCQDLALSVPFTLTGVQDWHQVKLSAISTNEDILPNDATNISIQGSGNNRVLVITPVEEKTGETMITLRVTEGNGIPCKTSFQLTVKPLQEILSQLYLQTDGDNWYINEGWKTLSFNTDSLISLETVCSWYGIECNVAKTSIIGLSLASNRLKGQIPSDLCGLTDLESINLSYNLLEGEIPHQISGLSKLKKFNFASNMLSGHLPKYIDHLNALKIRASDLRWNALHSNSEGIKSFLSNRQVGGDWMSTQTLAPSNLAITMNLRYLLKWDSIDYTQDQGGYHLVYATPVISPYDKKLSTLFNKHDSQFSINDLDLKSSYRFGIRAYTLPHENNPNTVFSEYHYINSIKQFHIPELKFKLLSLVKEESSPARVMISIDSSQTIDICLTVLSDDETVVPTPSEITIKAGNTDAFFNLNVTSDQQYVSSKQVNISLLTMNQLFTYPIEVKDQETPYWRIMSSYTLNDLNALWGDSVSFVIAVGDYGTILHLNEKYRDIENSPTETPLNNDDVWKLMDSPTENNLYDVWGLSPDNIYAVGASGTILHFEGSVWQRMTCPISHDLHTIYGTSEENIFAGGENGSFLHYDGIQWRNLEFEKNNNDQTMVISDMWAYTDNKCLVIGQSENKSINAIIEMTTELNARMLTETINQEKEKYTAIWKTGNMLSVSGSFTDSELNVTGLIYQYTETVDNYTNKNKTPVLYSVPDTQLNNIWGAIYNNMYAIGTNGAIIFHKGTDWEFMHSGTDKNLNDIWGVRDSKIFVVGDQGTILKYDSDQPNYAERDYIDIQPGTVQNDYQMASICVNLNDNSSVSALGIDMKTYSNEDQYRIGTYDPMIGEYIDYGPELLLEPGRAYWFLIRDGQNFPLYGRAVSHVLNFDLKLFYNSKTKNGWNMIACPNKISYEWSKIKVFIKNDAGEILDFNNEPLSEAEIPYIFELPDDNQYISKKIHKWVGTDAENNNKGYYSSTDMILKPNKGYWVESLQENVYLRFSRSAQLTDKRKRTKSMQSVVTNSPPAPMGEFSEATNQNKDKHVSDSFCFIKTILSF